jgi:hypothetical protein
MNVSKALSPRGWFTAGLVAAAALIALAVPEASAQPSLVGSSVRIELFFPNLTNPTSYRDYGFRPVVAGSPELVSPVDDDEFCGTCTIDIEASSIDVTFAKDRDVNCCVNDFNGFVFTLPPNLRVVSATLSRPPGSNATISWTGNILRINFGPVPGAVDIQAGDRFHIALELATVPGFPGALRLTDAVGGARSGLFYNGSIPTTQGLEITFKQYQYGGDGPGDGIAFVLAVAPPSPADIGETGGGLGYTVQNGAAGTGLPGGWLGIGLDVFGNFTSKNVDGMECGTGPAWADFQLHPNEVTVRGPGHDNVGYCLLSSSLEAGASDLLGPTSTIQLHGSTGELAAVGEDRQ